MKQTFRFYKTAANRWYIDLPEFEGSIDELEMVQGADTMLDMVSNNTSECYMIISDEPFEGADKITLVTNLSDSVGGGDYFMESYRDKIVNQNMWLCSVTVKVFNDLPAKIFVSNHSILNHG
jgi:hypothetical protein